MLSLFQAQATQSMPPPDQAVSLEYRWAKAGLNFYHPLTLFSTTLSQKLFLPCVSEL